MKTSVCLATYNGENFIYKQIESILKQLAPNDEVIISDDSSTDKTLYIIEGFNDSRLKIFKNNTYYNPIYNFENAINKSSGDIIVLSDQDDIWLDNKIEIIKNNLKEKTGKIYTLMLNGYIIDQNEDFINGSIFDYKNSGKGVMKNIIKNTYMGCSMAFTREVLDVILPFPKKIPMHDSWIGILSEIFGKVEFEERKTIKYRIHNNNQSLKKTNTKEKIIWRYNLINELIKRYIKINFNL
jgi:glycosyltransferase involved in cell wall biosynthesis